MLFFFILFYLEYREEIQLATEQKFDTVLKMTLEQVLAQRFNQSTKSTAKVINISDYLEMLQNQEITLDQCFNLKFFCHETPKYPQICCKCSEIRTLGEDGCSRKNTV